MGSLSSIRHFTMFYPTIQIPHTRENTREEPPSLLWIATRVLRLIFRGVSSTYHIHYGFCLSSSQLCTTFCKTTYSVILRICFEFNWQYVPPRMCASFRKRKSAIWLLYLLVPPNQIINCGIVWCFLGPRARAVWWWWWASHSVMRHSG